METIYFTDPGSGLTITKAAGMGVILIPSDLFYKGEPIEDIDGVILDNKYVNNFRPNAERYKDYFSKYKDTKMVFICSAGNSKSNEITSLLNECSFPNLTIIDSGLVNHAHQEVIRRVMSNKPWNDIKYFFVIKNSKTKIFPDEIKGKYNLYTYTNGKWDGYKLIETFDTKFAATARLKKLINSPLYYRKDLNGAMGYHFGDDYIGGIKVPLL